jgi:membrane protein YqaA with SNARE-associated domain
VTPPGPKWHERVVAWLESAAASPYAVPMLIAVCLVESSILPIPPDALFIPMAIARPRFAIAFGLICAAGSVVGGLGGYWIGMSVFDQVGGRAIAALGLEASFHSVLAEYHAHPYAALLASGFTNIPYFIFTIAAGYRETLDLATFILAAASGRLVRFLLLGGLLYFFGPAVGRFLRRYFPAVSFALLALFVVMILVARMG